ncbi:hypothetical protein PJP13_24130 [Mycobacterium kansasii]
MVATPRTKDYLGRALTNASPGTSDATDFLGRSIADPDETPTSDGDETDFLGRGLVV